MSARIEDVLAEHQVAMRASIIPGRCKCGHRFTEERDYLPHLAEELAEAGLGDVAQARLEERRRIAAEISGSFPYNGELRHDGSEDPQAAAYVEGLHDAWTIATAHPEDSPAPASIRDGGARPEAGGEASSPGVEPERAEDRP